MSQFRYCEGADGQPCRFSTSFVGYPRACRGVRCAFCDPAVMSTSSRRDIVRALAYIYIISTDIYVDALSRSPHEYRPHVAHQLSLMLPTPRRQVVWRDMSCQAVEGLLGGIKAAPHLVGAIKAKGRALNAARHGIDTAGEGVRCQIAEYIEDFQLEGERSCLARTLMLAYTLSRHPSFAEEHFLDDSELPLARAYSSAVDIHRAGLREVRAAVDAFVGALRRVGLLYQMQRVDTVIFLLSSMQHAPTLIPGCPLRARYFEPQDTP